MLRGTGTTSSVIHAAGAPGGGTSARPNALVVLVNTNRPTPAATASSSRFSVPVTLVSTNSARPCEPTWGLCSVAVWRIASMPATARRTTSRSAIEPTICVYGDASTSSPTRSPPSVRISASPRWPELPVMRMRMAPSIVAGMTLRIGDTAPDFEAETTEGTIRFHEWIGDSWAVLFSHPKDFTPVCTTELGYMAQIKPEFDRRDVKIIGLSVDPVDRHAEWAKDIESSQGTAPNYPTIGDADYTVSKLYDMLPADGEGDPLERPPADNQTVRNVFVVGPDKKIKLVLAYPMTTGRNFDEVLRVIDSLQLTAKHKVATPVNWKQGDDVIIAGSVSDEQAREQYPEGWDAPLPYMRIVKQPAGAE